MSEKKSHPNVTPVILCGGAGTRLWPVSRKGHPKQFWPLISDKSMLVETALRTAGSNFTTPIVVASHQHRFTVAGQLAEAGLKHAKILLEPVGRNSAPAIAAAALYATEHNPEAVLWVMAADAVIKDLPAMYKALDSAVAAAKAGYIVTFGMEPTAPETGYGYLQQGQPVGTLQNVYKLDRFVEKPDADTATNMLSQGNYFWNSGMFVFRADVMLDEMRKLAPEILDIVQQSMSARVADPDFIRLPEVPFASAPDISIDYAIAEKTKRAVMVPASIGWSDVGSWSALADISPSDENGNFAHGDAILEDSTNCYVRSDGTLTALLGVKDLVVVTTQDAILVAHKNDVQNVKKIVKRLKAQKRGEADDHVRIYRPWGFYEGLAHGERFQVKRIVVQPGRQLSLQKHFHRAEHWVVVGGVANVTCDDKQVFLSENESIYLPLGSIHRLENPGKIPLTLIEVQSGAYLGEDDIVRYEDTYGRS